VVPRTSVTLNAARSFFFAAFHDRDAELATLIAAGEDVNRRYDEDGMPTALYAACYHGCSNCVTMLIAAGANVDSGDEYTPLFRASERGDNAVAIEIVSQLCEAGANVNSAAPNGTTPLGLACFHGSQDMAKLLSSYGASRDSVLGDGRGAEQVATDYGHANLATWLGTSQAWNTPLHHLTTIPAARARALLRGGADLHAASQPGGPTPLSLAEGLRTAGDAPEGSAADLVLSASRLWSPQTHALFPVAAREHAVAVFIAGHLLARETRFEGVAVAMLDVWMAYVLPHAVTRG